MLSNEVKEMCYDRTNIYEEQFFSNYEEKGDDTILSQN
jgi:hypothetical protein